MRASPLVLDPAGRQIGRRGQVRGAERKIGEKGEWLSEDSTTGVPESPMWERP